jgi:two-component system, NarL family, nitrate/nitrite response regulator NarL
VVITGDTISVEWLRVLSPREREVALLVARGLANKEIARELGLSDGTVKQHVHNIFLKLGTRKRHMLRYLVRGSTVAENAIWQS